MKQERILFQLFVIKTHPDIDPTHVTPVIVRGTERETYRELSITLQKCVTCFVPAVVFIFTLFANSRVAIIDVIPK